MPEIAISNGKKKSIVVRINPELCNELNILAKDELRRLNGQMEFVLREAVRKSRE